MTAVKEPMVVQGRWLCQFCKRHQAMKKGQHLVGGKWACPSCAKKKLRQELKRLGGRYAAFW